MFEKIRRKIQQLAAALKKSLLIGVTGAAGAGAITYYLGAETVSSTVASFGGTVLAALPGGALMPIIAVAGLAAFTGSVVYEYYHSQQTARGAQGNYDDRLKEMQQNFTNKEFTLLDYDQDYLSKSVELLRKKIASQKDYTLKKICIKPQTINDLQRLMEAGLGRTKANYLEISGTTLGGELVNELRAQVIQEAFSEVETLILKNNGIPPSSLMQLSEIGKNLKIKTLDLSENNLNDNTEYHGKIMIQTKNFENFIVSFHRNFASVKKLIINNVNKANNEMLFLKELFAQPSLLETIELKENKMGPKAIAALLNGPEYQYNLNIRHMETGHNDSPEVIMVINSRETRNQSIRSQLGETSVRPIVVTTHILERLRTANSAFPRELTEVFSHIISSQGVEQKVEDKWKLLADKFTEHMAARNRQQGEKIEDVFVQFKINEKSDQDFVIEEAIKRVLDARSGARVELSFNHPGVSGSFDSTEIVRKLTEGLTALKRLEKREKPVIRKMDFHNVDIKSIEFSNLLTEELGDYGTEELNLANNKLDDNNMLKLKKLDSTTFSRLKSLNLSGNAISVNGLEALVYFCRKVGIESLDISNNRLCVEGNGSAAKLRQFFMSLHYEIPTLRKINVSDIGLANINKTDNEMLFLKELFSQPSLLETIELKKNKIDPKAIATLLNSPEYQYNLNIRHLETGHNDSREVKSAIDSRETRNQSIRSQLAETSVRPIVVTTHILERLRTANSSLPQELTQVFSQAISSQGVNQTVGDKWKLLADKFADYMTTCERGNNGRQEEQIEDVFVQFRINEKSDQDFVIEKAIKRVVDARSGERVELSFNHSGVSGSFNSIEVVKKLTEGLTILDRIEERKKPVIRKMDFHNVGINSVDFANLLAAGLGGYHTEELNLANNKLGNEDMLELVELIQGDSTAFSRVKSLNLSGNAISVNGLEALVYFCRKVGIESLDISNNRLYVEDVEGSGPAVKLAQFFMSLYYEISTLRKINVSDIGLTEETFSLLLPLVSNMSLLEEVEAGQASIKKSTAYEKFYRRADFSNNIILKTFDVRKNTFRQVQINKRKELLTNFQEMLSPAEQGWARLSVLLTKFMKEGEVVLPAAISKALKYVTRGKDNPLLLSNKRKLEIMARNLQFHRDKAQLKDSNFQFPAQISVEEIVAFKQGRLTEYWSEKMGDNPMEDREANDNFLSKYRKFNAEEKTLNACEMISFQIKGRNLKIYYVEDDTIRIIDFERDQQCILSRYLTGKAQGVTRIIISNNLFVNFEPTGNVEVLLNNVRQAYLKGYDVLSSSPVLSKIGFFSFPAADMESLFTEAPCEEPRSEPFAPQFTNHREATRSSNPSRRSSPSSSSPPLNPTDEKSIRMSAN